MTTDSANVDVWSARAADREVDTADTLHRMVPHLSAVGITRLGDITGLDRVGIPVFQAICPRSRDTISVYSGKGVTADAARVSAVMEATERFCATQDRAPARVASVAELRREDPAGFLRPEDHLLPLRPGIDDDTPLHWLRGTDLGIGAQVLVPQQAVTHGADGYGTACYRITSTNGLAAGNTHDEAVLHGLCEVIERDDWTFADAIGNQLPKLRARRRRRASDDGGAGDGGVDDCGVTGPGATYRQLRIDTLPPIAAELAGRFSAAGIGLTMHVISRAGSLTTVLATSVNDGWEGSGRYIGLGTSPDPLLAVTRSLTELAQSRAGDISATREDLTAADEHDAQPWDRHIRRTTGTVGDQPWDRTGAEEMISFDSLADESAAAERRPPGHWVRQIVGQLGSHGMRRVIVVDLSVDGLPAKVVRVIVPGLESWAAHRSRIGHRLLTAWNAAVEDGE
ncbi:YcaO-like family protein [Microlunatus soli]|uniref:Ribosomal protein S12 methylthiotransferase accessory factor n=1 Tax=Microlunatus soli TaxID=630515 RepID=A0A1H1YV18_9ACTN|nr:YcaO-like family protein [Microlunatus soli]SDT25314.1 ribosomal protein S12 methylthiotransferase accessory factor [Microlunatus soli]